MSLNIDDLKSELEETGGQYLKLPKSGDSASVVFYGKPTRGRWREKRFCPDSTITDIKDDEKPAYAWPVLNVDKWATQTWTVGHKTHTEILAELIKEPQRDVTVWTVKRTGEGKETRYVMLAKRQLTHDEVAEHMPKAALPDPF